MQISNFSPPPHRNSKIGKIVSLLMFASFLTIYPALIKTVWPTIMETFSQEPYLYLFVLIGTTLLVLVPYNLIMLFIYQAKIPFFQQYRCSSKPWPWQSNPEQWRKLFRRTILTVLFNLFILNSVLPFLQMKTGGIKYKSSIQEWPSPLTMLGQIIFFIFFEDFGFYWAHKLLHKPQWYWIHKQHHEYNITITLTSTYSHPIQYFFSNVLPTGYSYHLLAKVSSVHYVTIIAWLTMRLMETCDGHSGYDWSWGQFSFIPWKLDPDYHNFHHSQNVGNFGSMFTFWDNIMKTNVTYRQAVKQGKIN